MPSAWDEAVEAGGMGAEWGQGGTDIKGLCQPALGQC